MAKYDYDQDLMIYLNEISGYPLLDREDERRLSAIINDNNSSKDMVEAAKKELVEANLLLVVPLLRNMLGLVCHYLI